MIKTQALRSSRLNFLTSMCVAVLMFAVISLAYEQQNLDPVSAHALSVATTTAVGTTPISAVMFDSSTGELYVASIDYRVRVIDPSTMSVKKTVVLNSYPVDIVKNPSAGTMYLSMHYTNVVTVLDAVDKTIITTIGGLSAPWGIGVNPTTNTAYVVNINSKELTVINGTTNKIKGTVQLGPKYPMYIAVNPVTNMIYVTAISWEGDTLHVIDGSNN